MSVFRIYNDFYEKFIMSLADSISEVTVAETLTSVGDMNAIRSRISKLELSGSASWEARPRKRLRSASTR